MRCDSPPESVSAERSRLRYCKPTLFKKRRRVAISRRIRDPICALAPGNWTDSAQAEACCKVHEEISQIP